MVRALGAHGHSRHFDRRPVTSGLRRITLQKSKVAPVQIFGETLKREAIHDSDNLSRATEVAYEFCVRRRGPSDPHTKTRLRPSEFLTPSARRLLQYYPPISRHARHPSAIRLMAFPAAR